MYTYVYANTYVTGFLKTDQYVMHKINGISMFKYFVILMRTYFHSISNVLIVIEFMCDHLNHLLNQQYNLEGLKWI